MLALGEIEVAKEEFHGAKKKKKTLKIWDNMLII